MWTSSGGFDCADGIFVKLQLFTHKVQKLHVSQIGGIYRKHVRWYVPKNKNKAK